MDTQLTAWLNEGLTHYAAGDHAGALESWHRILAVDPEHPAALEYVAVVRDTIRREATTTSPSSAPATAPEPSIEMMPAPAEATPAPAEAMPAPAEATPAPAEATPTPAETTAPSASSTTTGAAASPLLSTSWADLVGDDLGGEPGIEPGIELGVELGVPARDPLATVPTPPAHTDREATPAACADIDSASASSAIAPASGASALPVESTPLPSPEVSEPGPDPGPPPAIARWASPRVTAPKPPPAPTAEFEPLQPFELEALDMSDPGPTGERPGAGFTVPPAPPALPAMPPPTPPPPPMVPATSTATSTATSAAPMPTADGGAWEAAGQGTAPVPRPSSNPWANIPRTATPAPQFGDLLPPPPSPVLRPAPTGEIYRSGSAVDVVPAERPAAARVDVPPPQPAATGASPWDGDAGPATTLDLDAKPIPRTPTPAPGPAHAPPPATAATAAAAAVDELDALMTGARELFALGDFSGSLELVEKVLQREPAHEGARAYLKRNETTLLKMYESKLGQLGSVPSQLVPPDEVIWLHMHHRAGFILSQVDGTLSYEDLIDVSGMDRFDTIRILADLVHNGIIGVK